MEPSVSPRAGTKADYLEVRVVLAIDKYVNGAVFIVGMTGNILSIVVLQRKRFHDNLPSFYLTVLGVMDLTVVVLGLGVAHLPRVLTGFYLPSWHPWTCKIWNYCMLISRIYSSWVLATISIDRCLAIWNPLQHGVIATKNRSRVILVTLLLIVLILFVYGLVEYDVITITNSDIS
jgi:ABC-type Na+ efflux pump permease subunit